MFYIMETWSNWDATHTRTVGAATSAEEAEQKAKERNAARAAFPGSVFFVGDGVDRCESNGPVTRTSYGN
jgi:hypothetical protein